MQVNALLLLALSVPFLIILVGMIGYKWSALKAGGVALLATLAGPATSDAEPELAMRHIVTLGTLAAIARCPCWVRKHSVPQ